MSTGLPAPSDLSPSGGLPLAAIATLGRGFPQEPVTELDWRYYLKSVLRHKRVVIVAGMLGLAAGVAAGRFLMPTYSARASLWVETAKDGGGNPGPTWSNQLLGATGWVDLLRSDLIVVDAVRVQRLYLVPTSASDAAALSDFTVQEQFRAGIYEVKVDETGQRYTLTSKDGVAQSGAVGDSIGVALGFHWQPSAAVLPPNSKVRFEVVSLYAATEKLLEVLDVRPGRDRNFIRIDLRGPDPQQLAATVNTMANHLVRVAADLKRQKLTELTAILGEQLRQAETSLKNSEEVLKEFKARNATAMLPEAHALPSGFLATRVEQEQLRLDREAIAEVLASADSGASLHALARIGSVQKMPDLTRALEDLITKEAELRALSRRYTDAHPVVQQAATDVKTTQSAITAFARTLVSALSAGEARLTQRVESASEGIRAVSPLSVQQARLDRDVRVAEELFIALRRRYEEARLADLSTTPDVRVLDAARQPEEPLYDHAPLAILLALVGGLGVGIVAAVALDLFDPKVRYPAQVTHDLGLPLLGVVPHVPPSSAKDENGLAPVIEALRGVRFNALHAYGTAGPMLFTVTSPGMGDGKSFITSNLALAFADARYRTLLVDGDIRRGALHRVLKASRKPGLTDFLSGEATAEEIVQTTAYPGLSFIGAGARRRAGPELLSSPALTRLFADLRSMYDVIIVDSSPLAAGIDPYALGTLTGNLVLVVRTGVTNRELAGAKLELLGRLPIRVLGTIINDVRPGSDNRYSYYMAGYELEEEITATNGAGRRILPVAEVSAASTVGEN